MIRTILLWLGGFALFFAAAIAQAQQSGKLTRIGFLDASTATGNQILLDEFRRELRKLGWNEGANLTIDYRFAEQNPARLPALAKELVDQKVELIVAPATAPALAAKASTSTIPIVMVTVGDPVAAKLIDSLARPGGNVTGLSNLGTQLNTKSLEVLREVVPTMERIAVLSAERSLGQELQLKEIRAASAALKLDTLEIAFDLNHLDSAFESATKKRADAAIVTSARRIFAVRKKIVELAAKYRLPVIYPQDEYVEAGGLVSYGTDLADLFRRAAVYVDKILKGAKPADLPVERPIKFELVINLKAAKVLGLSIPQWTLTKADRVIR